MNIQYNFKTNHNKKKENLNYTNFKIKQKLK